MKDFQNVLLPLTKPFEINSEFTAINPLTSLTLLKSSGTADTSNSITPPISRIHSQFLNPQNDEVGKSFEQFLIASQFLSPATNTLPSEAASSDILTGEKLAIPGIRASSQLPSTARRKYTDY